MKIKKKKEKKIKINKKIKNNINFMVNEYNVLYFFL